LKLAALLVVLVAAASPAHAGDTCRAFGTPKFSSLPERIRQRFSAGEHWAAKKNWKDIRITVYLQRAPHLVAAILKDCDPSVKILSTNPADQRRFTSYAEIQVTSFATLVRIVQLPSVTYLSAHDTSVRIKHPHGHFIDDFE